MIKQTINNYYFNMTIAKKKSSGIWSIPKSGFLLPAQVFSNYFHGLIKSATYFPVHFKSLQDSTHKKMAKYTRGVECSLKRMFSQNFCQIGGVSHYLKFLQSCLSINILNNQGGRGGRIFTVHKKYSQVMPPCQDSDLPPLPLFANTVHE